MPSTPFIVNLPIDQTFFFVTFAAEFLAEKNVSTINLSEGFNQILLIELRRKPALWYGANVGNNSDFVHLQQFEKSFYRMVRMSYCVKNVVGSKGSRCHW